MTKAAFQEGKSGAFILSIQLFIRNFASRFQNNQAFFTLMKIIKKLRKALSTCYRRFVYLQHHGKPVPPMTTESCTCKNCGTEFTGNFCPRCGQSLTVSKVSKRGLVVTFIEAYPHLTHTFFTTITELFYRPGYMIRDFFCGRRVRYCGPFKTFFIVLSLITLLSHIVGIDLSNLEETSQQQPATDVNAYVDNVHYDKGEDEYNRRFTEKIEYISDLKRTADNFLKKYKLDGIESMIAEKANDSNTQQLFFFLPLLAVAAKLVMRKEPFNGRRMLYAEHLMVIVYWYTINLMYFVVMRIIAGAYADTINWISRAISTIYLVWIYKELFGWQWRHTLKRIAQMGALTLAAVGLAWILIILFAVFFTLYIMSTI